MGKLYEVITVICEADASTESIFNAARQKRLLLFMVKCFKNA